MESIEELEKNQDVVANFSYQLLSKELLLNTMITDATQKRYIFKLIK
jgi:hypothetical protein